MKKRLNVALDTLKLFGTMSLAPNGLAALFYVASNGNLNNPMVAQGIMAAVVFNIFTVAIVVKEFITVK